MKAKTLIQVKASIDRRDFLWILEQAAKRTPRASLSRIVAEAVAEKRAREVKR